MSGLILGGLMRGVGAGGASFGDTMVRADSAAQLQREKYEYLQQMRQDSDATRLAIAAEKAGNAGSKAGAGNGAIDMAEGGMGEEAAAGRMGMSVPALRALRKANQTGDFSAYATDNGQELPGPTEDGSELHGRSVSAQTQGALQDKSRVLAEIQTEYLQGKNYKEVTEGRRTEMGNQVGQGIIGGKLSPQKGAEEIAALKGDGAYKEGGSTVYSEFSGENTPTAVGKSQITKNNAEAGEAGAKAKAAGAGAKDTSLQTLQQMRIAASDEMKEANRKLSEFDKLSGNLSSREREARAGDRKALVQDASEAQQRLRDLVGRLTQRLDGPQGASAPKAEAAPAAGGMAAPKSKSDYDRLPRGTRYRAPDGSLKVKG